MSRLIAFCKPFNVLCQFSPEGDSATLADYISVPGVYPAGRLDKDSEGLLLLTDHGPLQHRISHPRQKMPKIYWVQVEGEPDATALAQLARGVLLKDGKTAPAQAKIITEPDLWPRVPPIRFRANIPTTWLEITLKEGRNRQVRRMTAAVGYPTLRLVRYAVGPWSLDPDLDTASGDGQRLLPGQWREIKIDYEYLDYGTRKRTLGTPRHRRRRHRE